MMTNEEYASCLKPKVNALLELRNEAKQLTAGIIGETLTTDDLFFCASTDRCMRLIDGFIPMLQDRNLTCVGVLLRMQMDNCMRTYAAFIAKKRTEVINAVIDGEHINKLKDVDGEKMTDGHLKDKITEKLDSQFATVYDNASGYVHLSEKAFYQTVVDCENYHLGLGIGTPLPEKRNESLLEAADAYIHFVKLNFRMLQAVVESKQRFDKEYNKSLHES